MEDERESQIERPAAEIDEQGRNPTQQRMDEEGLEPAAVDASWVSEDEPQAAVDDDVEPTFEPDVPLVAEVNREAGESSDRRRRLGVLAAGAALVAGVVLRRRSRRRR